MNTAVALVARIAYYVLVTPIGLVSRLFSDPLTMRRPPVDSNWRRIGDDDPSLVSAGRQS